MPARLAPASALIKQTSPRDLRIETTLLPVVGAIQVGSGITNCLRLEGHTRIRSIGNMSESVENFKLLFQNRIQPIKGFDGNGVGLRSGQVQIIFSR